MSSSTCSSRATHHEDEGGWSRTRLRDWQSSIFGGHRFRPCLEDVLEALANEFGIDVKDGWREAIREGREEWRRMQLRAAVRDAPRDVAEVLRSMGYEVIDPAEPPADRLDRLQSF